MDNQAQFDNARQSAARLARILWELYVASKSKPVEDDRITPDQLAQIEEPNT